jgi:TctA family transporter
MTLRIITALAALVAGACLVFIGVDNLAGNELARFALTFLFGAGVIAAGIYLIGAGVVLLTHETWVSRVVERLKQ